MTPQRRITLPDLHIPFHDKRAFTTWKARLWQVPFDGVDIIGDLLDCYTLSRFDTNPARKADIQQELDIARGYLAEIRGELPKADIRYSEGNHEDRLRKRLWGKDRDLAPIRGLSIPELLKLDDLNIKWHSTQDPYKIRNLWYTHGDILRKHAGMSARAKSDIIHGSVMIGHTHRQGWSPYSTWDGIDDGYECGYLADPSQLDYVRSPSFNWQPGWTEVEFDCQGFHHVHFYRILQKGRSKYVVGPDGVIDQWRVG
jgi:hypothetical protein